jgi:hypothetical protein
MISEKELWIRVGKGTAILKPSLSERWFQMQQEEDSFLAVRSAILEQLVPSY